MKLGWTFIGSKLAMVRRVSLGRESSDGEILRANCCMSVYGCVVGGVSVLCWSVSVLSLL